MKNSLLHTHLLPPPTPTLERVLEVRKEAEILSKFLAWLKANHGKSEVLDLYPDKLYYEYFDIDPAAEDLEKREILAHQRLVNAQAGIRDELKLPTYKPGEE